MYSIFSQKYVSSCKYPKTMWENNIAKSSDKYADTLNKSRTAKEQRACRRPF